MLYSEQLIFANLVFIVTLSISRLEINPTNTRVFRLKLPWGCMEILSINTIDKHFASNLLFQGSIEKGYLSKNVKSLTFCGV